MKKILLLATITAFISCQKEESKASDKIDAKKSDSVTAAVASAYEAQLKNMSAPAQVNPMANTATVQPNTSTTSVPVTKPGMNPPHGQPGHRCDIQVGAPLNSKPATNNPQTSATITKQTPTPSNNGVPSLLQPATEAPKPVAQKTAEGWQGKANPAHGQEGHRCDVPVGEPLP